MIVDGYVNVLPADASGVALSRAVAGDAMTDLVELGELFDVDMQHLAGTIAFIAPYRLGGFQRREPIEAEPAQNTADGGRGEAPFHRDLRSGVRCQ